jgi:hypothetical protein
MRATFVEARGFSGCREEYLSDVLYARLQQLLMARSDAGDVMPGCGGLRKVRVGDALRGKGKRGGIRVVYLHVPEAGRFYMIDVYDKDERDDLSPADKKLFRQLARAVKAAAVAQSEKRQEETGS